MAGVLSSMLGLLASLLTWPMLLPWTVLLLGERLAARALGVYLGLLQVSEQGG